MWFGDYFVFSVDCVIMSRTVDQLCGLVIILCLELEYKNCGCVICAEVTLCG